MRARLLLFMGIVTLVLRSTCFYMAKRSMTFSPTLQKQPRMVWASVTFFLVIQFGVPFVHRALGLAWPPSPGPPTWP